MPVMGTPTSNRAEVCPAEPSPIFESAKGRLPDIDKLQRVARACNYDVNKLAAWLKLSRRSLERLFRRHIDRTPHAWLQACRVSETAALLQTGQSVKAIVAILGYMLFYPSCPAFQTGDRDNSFRVRLPATRRLTARHAKADILACRNCPDNYCGDCSDNVRLRVTKHFRDICFLRGILGLWPSSEYGVPAPFKTGGGVAPTLTAARNPSLPAVYSLRSVPPKRRSRYEYSIFRPEITERFA